MHWSWFVLPFLMVARLVTSANDTCPDGNYNQNGVSCCLCPRGLYVQTHCTSKNGTLCENCPPDFYNDKANSKENCERCHSCNENLHLEEDVKCTPLQDRTCRCMVGYYMDSCEHKNCPCHECEKCTGDVVQECTHTSNTVCGRSHACLIPTILTCVLVLIIIIFIIWKSLRKQLYSTPAESRLSPEEEHLFQGVDLEPFLDDIAELLHPRVVRKLALRTGITATVIDMHNYNNPQDPRENNYRILRDWHQKAGLKMACPQLVGTLRKMGENVTADKVIKMVKDQRAAAEHDIP